MKNKLSIAERFYRSSQFRLNFLKLWLKRDRLTFDDLYTDQELLFEGANCKVCWICKGAFKISLYLNGTWFADYMPWEIAIIPVAAELSVRCVAHGPVARLSREMNKHVAKISFKKNTELKLADLSVATPSIITATQIMTISAEPENLVPTIRLLRITLDSLKMYNELTVLNLKIESAENNSNLTTYHHGNHLL